FARGFTRFDDFAATDMFARTGLGQRLAFLVVYHDLFRKVMVRIGFRSLDRMQVVGDGGLRRRGPEITHSVLGWIDHDRSRPFFAFLNYFDVHPPFRGAHSLGQKFSHGDRTLVNDYDDGVADVDEYVADLLHELDRRGLTENTFIIFTSDHGELLNEHG